jgi:hypothetical protein
MKIQGKEIDEAISVEGIKQDQELKLDAMRFAQGIAREVWEEQQKENSEIVGIEKYVKEKIDKNNKVSIENLDNFPFFIGQFDIIRQAKFLDKISKLPKGKVRTFLQAACLAYFKPDGKL